MHHFQAEHIPFKVGFFKSHAYSKSKNVYLAIWQDQSFLSLYPRLRDIFKDRDFFKVNEKLMFAYLCACMSVPLPTYSLVKYTWILALIFPFTKTSDTS